MTKDVGATRTPDKLPRRAGWEQYNCVRKRRRAQPAEIIDVIPVGIILESRDEPGTDLGPCSLGLTRATLKDVLA